MTWLFLASGSVIFFISLNLLQKVIAVKSVNSRAMAMLFNATASLLAILIFFLTGSYRSFVLPTNINAWVAVGIACFFYGMYERGRFIAAKHLDASVLTVISNLSVFVAFVGSLVLYSESLTINKILGGILIITALLIVSVRKNKKEISKKGLIVAIAINIMIGLAWMLDKLGTRYFNANTYNIFVWVIPLIFIYFPRMKFAELKSELKLVSWKILILSALNVIGYLMQLKALEIAEATKVIPIVQTSTIFTIIFGIFILKEKENTYRKLCAGALAILGVYLLI